MPPLSPYPSTDTNADSQDNQTPDTKPLEGEANKNSAKDDISAASNTPAANPLSYPLGADDISKIVDALLTTLSPLFPKNLTKEQQYVSLHKAVLLLSKGKTFTNKDDLNNLVKDIVKGTVMAITNRANKFKANPDTRGSCGPTSWFFAYLNCDNGSAACDCKVDGQNIYCTCSSE
jgi:hypothetical protein